MVKFFGVGEPGPVGYSGTWASNSFVLRLARR
jgi:hypothetical protein